MLYSHMQIHIYIYTCIYMQHHKDTINKQTSEDFFNKICTSHFICNVCEWERVGDRTELQYFDPHSYSRQRCVFLVLQMLNRRPSGPALCWVMAFFTASYQQLLWTPNNQGPKGPLRWAFSTTSLLLTRLISNWSDFCLDWVI